MDRPVIGRRAMLAACVACAGRPAKAALAAPPQLAFRMIRHDTDIGRHILTFAPDGDTLTVQVAVDAVVTLLSIPIVRYKHRATETWHGGTLVRVSAATDKNGDHEWVNAQRAGTALVVSGSKTARYIAPENALATSYWNKRLLDGPMISMEDGVLLHPKVDALPAEPIAAAAGRITAEHFKLTGPLNVELWYDRAATWAGFQFKVADGSIIHYERL
jgi:hypothetical protein